MWQKYNKQKLIAYDGVDGEYGDGWRLDGTSELCLEIYKS